MLLRSEEFNGVKQSLPTAFHKAFKNEKKSLIRALPLLSMVCKDERLIISLHEALNLSSFFLPGNQPSLTQEQLYSMCQSFKESFTIQTLVKHSLPLVLGEFPLHTRPINTAIELFNQQVENYHCNANLDSDGLKESYLLILTTITKHGSFCYSNYVWQLLLTLTGWSTDNLESFFKKHEAFLGNSPAITNEQIVTEQKNEIDLAATPVELVELEKNYEGSGTPFVPNYNQNINRAGRLANETYFLLLNAFGMKIGGHFDAQVHYSPRLIPLNQLHSMIARQLSHRLEVPQTLDFQLWLELALNELGVQYTQTTRSELYIIPFLGEPLNSLTPEKIRSVLEKGLVELASEQLNPDPAELEIIAHYLFELLQGFQIQPGQALGIGANWDGTVNLSNEAGAYPFKFIEEEANWGQRFKQLSLHRQGPAEVYMNAAKGINYELQALIKGFHHMSQLKPSEYKKILYNALVDNLMANLTSEPAYFENPDYPKYRKLYTVELKRIDEQVIESFYVPCSNGTYFKDKEGKFKQTPMYRRAGTLDVQAFPKNIACSAKLGASYAGNPLGPLRLQYLQSLHTSTRGHVVYNPLGRHSFLPDVFYGQVIRSDNGDLIPFTGVVPKNLDKYLKLPHELCASFVLRMLLSSRLMEYCPTFREACNQIKTRFLPGKKPLPALPNLAFSTYISHLRQTLEHHLNNSEASFSLCEAVFFSLFKNIVYHLYSYGKEDEHFKSNYNLFINNSGNFQPVNKATCEKIIRYLTVNNPVLVSSTAKKGYEDCLGYLVSIVQHFYPIPSDRLAKQIASQAQIHTIPLLNLASIKAYFSNLKTLKSANLSPRQTPGMVYTALKYGSSSKAVFKDYRKMHTEGFLSYYRDPEGMPYGEPQTYETRLDLGAKLLGASLQLAHKYNLLAIAREPLVQPYVQAREMAAQYRNQKSKALWIMLGGLKGFFWNGICQGTWLTLKTPGAMATDLLSLLKKSEESAIENHALAISAAPSNEPNWKVNLIAKSRDFILHLMTSPDSNSSQKTELINYGVTIIAELYSLPEEALEACRQSLQTTFPLNQCDLSQLSNPFSECLDTNDPVEKQVLFHLLDHTQPITKDFLHAVFKCIVEPGFSEQPNKAIEDAQSFWKLTKAQNKTLKALIALYIELPAEHRQKFTELFQFGGKIHNALIKRDKVIHRLQIWMSNIYDDRWILQILHANQAGTLNEAKQTDSLFNHSILERTAHNKSSPKDNAHSKWRRFAERERNHQILEKHEVDKIFEISVKFLKRYPELVEKLNVVKENYDQLVASDFSDNGLLEKFYYTTVNSLESLEKIIIKSSEIAILLYENPRTIMRNFLDVTMNAVVNSRLDKLDFLSEKEMPPNPLIKIEAIASWLRYVEENNSALYSLLEQQRLTSSVDEALWRIKYILQILELQNSHQPIKKTGIQKSLRIWYQHKNNITNTGEDYTDSKTGELARSHNLNLFSDSPTLKYAQDRVIAKLPLPSIIRQ